MKKLFALVVVVVLTFVLTGCTSPVEPPVDGAYKSVFEGRWNNISESSPLVIEGKTISFGDSVYQFEPEVVVIGQTLKFNIDAHYVIVAYKTIYWMDTIVVSSDYFKVEGEYHRH